MNATWAAVLICASNLSALAVMFATTYFKIREIRLQYDDMRHHLSRQDAAAGRIENRIVSVGRHADIRYIERCMATPIPTPEQTRLAEKMGAVLLADIVPVPSVQTEAVT
jgi:hypothetical protein